MFGTKKPVFDPALGDPLGKVILSEAGQGKINTLLEKVDLLRTGEWDRRAFYIDLAGEYLTNTDSMEMLPVTLNGFYKLKPANRIYLDPDTDLDVLIHDPISRGMIAGMSDRELIGTVECAIKGQYRP